jgi:hemerythrin-like metal-binding protein
MTWMPWNETLRTGHARFDEAHEKLVGIVNQLADGMESDKPKSFCDGLLDEFIEEIHTHFAMEEQLMAALHYPKAAEHIAVHRTLLKDVLAFRAAYDAGATAQSATLLAILDTWLTRDMAAADRQLVDFIAAAA